MSILRLNCVVCSCCYCGCSVMRLLVCLSVLFRCIGVMMGVIILLVIIVWWRLLSCCRLECRGWVRLGWFS